MLKTAIAVLTVSSAGLSACVKQEPASPEVVSVSPQPVASVQQVMLGITIPASDIVFAVAGESPADDAAWTKVQANAAVLAESAAMLMQGSRKLDDGEWSRFSQALYDAARAAANAAAEKNADKVGEAGNAIYETCDGCHQKYMPARQGENNASQ